MTYRPVEILKDEAALRELQRIAQALGPVDRNNLRILYVEPEKPQDGDSAICDGVHWDPLGDGIKQPVWYDATVPAWKALGSGSGSGPPGPQGDPGIPGADGAQGLRGFAGAMGHDGEPGDMGFPGLAGTAGAAGAAGAAGPQGPTGLPLFLVADTVDGEPGPPGRNGTDGAAGATGNTGAQGPTGPPIFLVAEDGLDGEPGVPGRQGIDGAAGQTGNTGAQGPTGPPIFLAAEDGLDGEPGTPGKAGADGAAGSAGTTGAQGPMGPVVLPEVPESNEPLITPPFVKDPFAARAVYNGSVAQQGAGFATDTYLTGSSIPIPANALKVGTMYRCRFNVVKSGAGTQTPIINIRFGTAGAVGDTSRGTLTWSVQTAVADEGVFEIWATFRVVGGSAVLQTLGRLAHRLSITGFGTGVSEPEIATSGTFDSGVANSIIGLSVNGGTSASWTINLVQAELINLAAM